MLSDLKYALRLLLKSPGFTLVAIATLALGLGANTAIFTLVNAVLLRPPGYPNVDRVVRVLEAPPGGGRNVISTLNFLDWQKQNTVFAHMAMVTGTSMALANPGGGEPARVSMGRVSAAYFDVLGLRPALGRTFAEGEDQAGKDRVAILSNTIWQNRFGADPKILGQAIHLDGDAYTVIGVLPAGTPLENGRARIWVPEVFAAQDMTRDFHWFSALALLKPGVTLEQARAQMDGIGARLARDYPDSNKGWGVGLDLLADTVVDPQIKQSLYVLFGAVGMVLLIAAANLANLSLMRAVGREREIAVRIALGAGRGALLRQFLAESITVSLLGGALGLAVGQTTLWLLKSVMPRNTLPADVVVSLDGRVLLFSFALAVLTGVIIGLLPALQAARVNLTASLKQGGGASTGGTHARMRSALVMAEVALAFVLLTGSGLLIRSLDKLSKADLGFDSSHVLVFGLPVSDKRFPEPAALNAYLRRIRARLEQLPGVSAVALASVPPLQGWGYGMPFQIADRKVVDRANRDVCFFKMVSGSYFHAIGMHLLRGRLLADGDAQGRLPVAVINESMAKKYFATVDPIGKQLLVQQIIPGKPQLGDEIPWNIVGVVADERVGAVDDTTPSPGMYVSNEQSPVYGPAMLLRSSIDPALLRVAVGKAVHEVDQEQLVPNLKALDAIKEGSLGSDRFRAMLLGTFAGVSLLLAAIGIYGVISYSVTQRTREIGIRAALGANRGNVIRLILRHGLTVAGIGLVIGVGGALGLTRLLASMLFGVSGHDPITMGVVAVLLGLVAFAACLFPAWRATKVDPIIALRAE